MAFELASPIVLGVCETYNLKGSEIPLDKVLRIQGYRDLAAVRKDVREIATAMTARAETLFAPTAIFRKVTIESCDKNILRLGTGTLFNYGGFEPILRNCNQVLPFILTLGEEIDKVSLELQDKGDIVEALFLETAGWIGIEQASRELAIYLQKQIEKDGLCLTRRFGPGYNEWNLLEQKDLFELFSDTELPVQLLESCAMLPKKSRSGLYGLRPLSSPRSSLTKH